MIAAEYNTTQHSSTTQHNSVYDQLVYDATFRRTFDLPGECCWTFKILQPNFNVDVVAAAAGTEDVEDDAPTYSDPLVHVVAVVLML